MSPLPIVPDIEIGSDVLDQLDFPLMCEMKHGTPSKCDQIAKYIRTHCGGSLQICETGHAAIFDSIKRKSKCIRCRKPVAECWRDHPIDGV